MTQPKPYHLLWYVPLQTSRFLAVSLHSLLTLASADHSWLFHRRAILCHSVTLRRLCSHNSQRLRLLDHHGARLVACFSQFSYVFADKRHRKDHLDCKNWDKAKSCSRSVHAGIGLEFCDAFNCKRPVFCCSYIITDWMYHSYSRGRQNTILNQIESCRSVENRRHDSGFVLVSRDHRTYFVALRHKRISIFEFEDFVS